MAVQYSPCPCGPEHHMAFEKETENGYTINGIRCGKCGGRIQ